MTAQAIHPPDLMRKLSRKIDQRKTVQLSPDELDLLVTSGALRMLEIAAADDGSDPRIPHECGRNNVFIYFMQPVSGGPVKIGFSKKPHDRRTSHQSSHYEEFEFIALFRAPQSFEKVLHHFYSPEWIRGEWFHPSVRLLRFAQSVGVYE